MDIKTEARILQLLEETRHPYRIQEEVQVTLSQVRKVMKDNPVELPGWGRLSLQPYIISRRGIWAGDWPSEDRGRILEHRRLHDQGRTTMCQGRDGQFILQYSIPTQRPVRRNPYFYGGAGC